MGAIAGACAPESTVIAPVCENCLARKVPEPRPSARGLHGRGEGPTSNGWGRRMAAVLPASEMSRYFSDVIVGGGLTLDS